MDEFKICSVVLNETEKNRMMTYRELFENGDNYHTYVGRGTQQEQQAVAKVVKCLEGEDCLSRVALDRIKSIKSICYLLVSGEMWCHDCHINITAMNKLCELQPKIKLSVISKGRAEDEIMERLGLDEILIPVVAVMNSEYEVIGQFIERPHSIANFNDNETVKDDYAQGKYLEATILEIINQLA
jgi:alkyl hydroperoxide reductase subunit AhpF